MSIINATPLLAAAGGDYQISRSVRLRSSATAYFNRTPASATNRTTWTWSAWFKRGTLSEVNLTWLFGAGSSDETNIYIRDTDVLELRQVTSGAEAWKLTSTQVFRDPSAWYHFVVACDTTQSTSSNRLKVYVNGVQITAWTTSSYPALNNSTYINNNNAHYIGKRASSSNYCDGYLTEVNFVDGQALTPSSFGETDAVTGVWKPKKYLGTYGTNGFYLNFSDNSAATAAAIGKDSSGNGNNWTPNNISVTTGVTYDSMTDVPTPYADGGSGRGNYAVLNPLLASASLSAGNLDFTQTNTKTAATFGVTSGKWYAEAKLNTTANGYVIVGVAKVGDGSSYNMFASGVGYYANDGTKYVDGTNTSYGATYTAGDTIGIALDMDGGTVTFYKNNTSQGSITLPASSQGYFPYAIQASSGSTSATWSANFGQRPFAYTPPTGYLALNTQNLPDSTIKKGNQYFDATTYTGNGSTQSIVNAGAFQPDLIWLKRRDGLAWHVLSDSVRGANKALWSNATDAETAYSSFVSSFNSNGFSLPSNTGADPIYTNVSGQTYIGWQWKAGAGTTSSNTSGSITSTVSVNQTAGFSVVTWTNTTFTNATVGHGLGASPSLIITKSRNNTSGWLTWHSGIGSTQYLLLQTTGAAVTNSSAFNGVSSTTFTLGDNSAWGVSGYTYVAYCWTPIAGYSAFGTYTGNGSADGPFVYCGFRPAMIWTKPITSTGSWNVLDNQRGPYNVNRPYLQQNTSDAEGTVDYVDFLSNGFKIRYGGASPNANGVTILYIAFAENPFKNALAR